MPNWNPSFPEVLGNEWMATRGHTHGVYAGEMGREQRLPSTAAETINSLKLSATLNPLLRAETYTVVDVIPQGSESQPLFTGVWMAPTSDVSINSWRTDTGAATNLFQAIDEDATIWGSSTAPAYPSWIENGVGFNIYECQVAATDFHTGGPLVNSRIGWVEVWAILGANFGYRKMRVSIVINSVEYRPGGGGDVDPHAFGASYVFQYGELNPATLKPWTPADIAQFRPGGNSKIRLNSWESSFEHFPKVYAVALAVFYLPTENRVAAGVWKRAGNIIYPRLHNVQTDSLITLPSGAAGWSKASGTRYLFLWRQAATPALYGAVIANDVRWNGLWQDLGHAGQPPEIVYPLTANGYGAPPPSTALASQMVTYEHTGRQHEVFVGDNAASYGIALVRSDAAISVDSQPYRLDVADIAAVRSTQKLGQRVVPSSSQSYIGVRATLIPPETGDATLTIAVRRVSDDVLMGGTFTITASAARALPADATSPGAWRYITGFLSSGASLVSGTAYEIRLTSSTTDDWLAAVLDASLGSTASFGGSTSGAFIGATHFPDRELVVTLVRQPDAPTAPTAVTTDVAVTTFSDVATTVKHVTVSWTLPAVGLGASFVRYEVERSLGENLLAGSAGTFEDGTVGEWSDVLADVTLAASTLQAHTGTWSLVSTRITSTGALNALSHGSGTSPRISVTPGEVTTTSLWVRPDTASGSITGCAIRVQYFDAANNSLGSFDSPTATLVDDVWQPLTFEHTAPALSATLRVGLTTGSVAVNDRAFIDDVSVIRGAEVWHRVAEVRTSSVVTWTDREVARARRARYRVRAVGVDGRFSAWAATGTVAVTDTRPMLVLSSNHSTSQFVHLYELVSQADADTLYPILGTQRDELIAIHGADYQVAFTEAEDRGMGWRTRVSLAQETMVTAVGMARFAALRALTRTLDVPYLCAMDHQGNHVFGHVSIDEGLQSQPAHHYSAALEITPTHSAPVAAGVT